VEIANRPRVEGTGIIGRLNFVFIEEVVVHPLHGIVFKVELCPSIEFRNRLDQAR
jgi:hypothetical protein